MALPILVQYCQNRADTDTNTASIDIVASLVHRT